MVTLKPKGVIIVNSLVINWRKLAVGVLPTVVTECVVILYKPFQTLTASHRLTFTSLFFIHVQMQIKMSVGSTSLRSRPDADWATSELAQAVTSLVFRTW